MGWKKNSLRPINACAEKNSKFNVEDGSTSIDKHKYNKKKKKKGNN